ncbi:hypothetical protein [Allorhodopirellula solitaria]|uniref:Uncharacterized protein n=1 Tax=Allorhodopirellula solitaria TaxID=2527987 RepID=A0A5C5WP74_9BACT|nr:hypothetical protein [Allorhodopirellula solitaria]TWT51901.1 hypothetical protein CA85_51640 [Allorhodopirellula solitaria]
MKTMLALSSFLLLTLALCEHGTANEHGITNGLDGWPAVKNRDLGLITVYDARESLPVPVYSIDLGLDLDFTAPATDDSANEDPSDARYILKTDLQIKRDAAQLRWREEAAQRLRARQEFAKQLEETFGAH